MIKEYEEELKALKHKMIAAEKFAKELPIFAKKILADKINGDEHWIHFGKYYKGMNFSWGINRGFYSAVGNRTVTNYPGNYVYQEYLFCIYINTLNIYDSHEKYGLENVAKQTKLFFYDRINSTFYVTDEHIESLLDNLVAWKDRAIDLAREDSKQGKIDKLQEQIDKLKS
jgi:hypothetical protein